MISMKIFCIFASKNYDLGLTELSVKLIKETQGLRKRFEFRKTCYCSCIRFSLYRRKRLFSVQAALSLFCKDNVGFVFQQCYLLLIVTVKKIRMRAGLVYDTYIKR